MNRINSFYIFIKNVSLAFRYDFITFYIYKKNNLKYFNRKNKNKKLYLINFIYFNKRKYLKNKLNRKIKTYIRTFNSTFLLFEEYNIAISYYKNSLLNNIFLKNCEINFFYIYFIYTFHIFVNDFVYYLKNNLI